MKQRGIDREREYQLAVALKPKERKPVTQDEFDQIVFDAIARDDTQSRPGAIRWAHREYVVVEKKR